MTLDEPKGAALANVAAFLGLSGPTALVELNAEALGKRTQRQLLEVAKRLGLSGASKLDKKALADRIAGTLADLTGSPKAQVAEPAEMDGGHLSHKFEVGKHAQASREEPKNIPWGYGENRVTAMPVDPDRLFVYWEVTDDAVAEARTKLGARGAGAWLNLRVYDTTGRIFDGTNAHGYFDHRFERHDRQWFFPIGKPTSESVVEIGMMSDEGFFAKIARSGRIEFPRREPAPWQEPEWMTVRVATGEAQHAGRGTPATTAAPEGSGFDPTPLWQMRLPWEEIARLGEAGAERHEWQQVLESGFAEGQRSFTWEGPITVGSWESGPFTYPVEVPEPFAESFVGPTQVVKVAEKTHIVYGPWQVVIRGLGAHLGRAVVARWEVHRSWLATEGHEIRGTRESTVGGSSELLATGASERRWLSASELRFSGSSELYFLGATEKLMRGASETLFAAASEWMMRGASDRRFSGSSETLVREGAEGRLGDELSQAADTDDAFLPGGDGHYPTPPRS